MEFVWVVRRRHLFPDCSPQGFLPLPAEQLTVSYLRTARARGFFVERREAETCPAWKQVIPYTVVAFEGRFLLLERLATQGEERLHGKLSIGVGGHINPEDGGADLILNAALRELAEEVDVGPGVGLTPLGLLNDDSNPVGAVHVGVVFGVRAACPPRVRETDKMRATLTPLADLRDLCHTPRPIESWSREILAVPGWENGF
jgi:predicted NUDIX family phosphoesterase